jgi:Tol biopolymer transport system component
MPRLRFSVTLLAFAAAPLGAQEKKADSLLTVEKYLDFEQVAEPRVSPDGSQIIYTRRWVNKLEDRFEPSLWIMNTDGSRNRFLTNGGSAVWSPDGTRIAYLADGKPSGTQIFVRWMDAEGATSQVTTLTDGPSDVRWSPDGKWIGFSSVVPKNVSWRIDMPRRQAPRISRIVQSFHFRQDRRGYMDPGYRHLFLVPADGGTPRQIDKGDFNLGARFDGLDGAVAWDWMPDGKTIITDGFADSTGDMNYRNSNVYSVDVATGTMKRLNSADGLWSSPAVSPDGKHIAYSGYTQVKDSYHTSELYVMNADGSGAKKWSGDLDRDVGDITWATDGSGVLRGCRHRHVESLLRA